MRRVHPRVILLALAFIFVLPVMIAWLLTRQDADWQPERTANHGQLVIPLRSVYAAGLANLAGKPLASDFLNGRWTFVFMGSSPCNDACREALYKTRQARLAMGQYMGRVQRLYVVSDAPATSERAALMQEHSDLQIARAQDAWYAPFQLDSVQAREAGRIYLIDPLGQLMMHYRPDAEAKGMVKDLKRLLRASKIG